MPFKIDGQDHLSTLQVVYLLAVALCVIGVGLALWNTHEANNDIRGQADSTAVLTQKLCKSFSDSRTASNKTIRAPLRESVYAIADIFRQSAGKQQDPAIKAQIIALANKFERYGDRVKDVGAVPCDFGQDLK